MSAKSLRKAANPAGRGTVVSGSARGRNVRVMQPRRGAPRARNGKF